MQSAIVAGATAAPRTLRTPEKFKLAAVLQVAGHEEEMADTICAVLLSR
jgi:hypothetical protein